MSKFILALTASDIAGQISSLLNSGGQLFFHLSRDIILNNNVEYIIKLHSGIIIGVMGLQQKNKLLTEMKHLCVHPDYRMTGLGKSLLELGIKNAKTKYVYGCVRSDNPSNIRNNFRVGMKLIAKYTSRGHYILIFARRTYVGN